VAGFGVWWLTSPPGGVGVQVDSFAYVSTGYFLAHGEGLRAPFASWASEDSTRTWAFQPPGFSAAIAGGISAGLAPLTAVRVIQSVSAAVTLFAVAIAACVMGGEIAALLAALILLASPYFWELHAQALSEPLFLAGFSVWAYLSVSRRRPSGALNAMLTLLPFVRYVSVGLIPAAAWNAWREPAPWLLRVRGALLCVVPATVAFVLWLWLVPGTIDERVRHVHWNGENFTGMPREAAITLIHLAIPKPVPGRSVLALAVWAFVIGLIWLVLRRDYEGRWRYERLAAGMLGIVAVLLPMSLLLDPSVRFDEQRHLLPAIVLTLIALAGAVGTLWSSFGRRVRGVMIAVAVVWLSGATSATATLTRTLRQDARFMGGHVWRESETVQWVRANAGAHALYTNQPWLLWFYASRVSRWVSPLNPEPLDVAQLRDVLARHNGILVDITLPWPAVESVAPLAEQMGLERVAQLGDGSVWRVRGQ